MTNLLSAVKKGAENGCDELVLSGGEPTLEPERIIELLKLAESLNYQKYIIQTNGAGLATNHKLVAFLDSLARNKDLHISFSVHGCDSKTHDLMSRKKGAFETLMKAFYNISQSNCKIYTNTVITTVNVNQLDSIAEMLLAFKPDFMQFSMLHLETPTELSVSMSDSVRAVKRLGKKYDLKLIKTEGIPYCLLHGMECCVGESFWPNILDLYNSDNKYFSDFKQLDYGMRKKLQDCTKCIFNSICMGVWKEHYEEFCSFNIHPIC